MRIKKHSLQQFPKDPSASMIAMAALALPVVIGMGALAVDIGYAYAVRSSAQQAVDFGGLAALAQLRDEEKVSFHPASYVQSSYAGETVKHASSNMPKVAKNKAVGQSDVEFGSWDFAKSTFNSAPNAFPVNAVRINAEFSEARGNAVPTFLGKLFKQHIDVSVSSLALLPIPPSFHFLSSDNSAALDMAASDVDVISVLVNSTAPDAMHFAGHSGNIGSVSFEVAGGMSGSAGSKVDTGAQPWADFLAELPEPSVDKACDYTNFETTGSHPVIEPGVYCGGLKISGAVKATFSSKGGIFVIKDGPFEIDASMRNRPIVGEGVLIYLTGKDSGLKFEGGDLTLRAPAAGPWAGVAIFAARGAEAPQVNTLEHARLFIEGIIYAPDSNMSFYRSFLNGTCNYLCFVSDTINLSHTLVNYGPFMAGRSTAFGRPARRPARPPALARKITPYVVPEPSS